jgi:hypothetical protein
MAWHGEPPLDKQHVLHGDDDPANNIPSNLRWGTHQENMAEAAQRGRMGRPPKLIAKQVLEIRNRREAGERGCDLAIEFGVSQATICDLMKGRTWGKMKLTAKKVLAHA